jgi:hypothetical protein
VATNWLTSGKVWTEGDFDYSANGTVDVNDLGLLATNWQAGVGNPLRPGGGEYDPEAEFLDGIAGLDLSQQQIDDLLASLGSGGGDPL